MALLKNKKNRIARQIRTAIDSYPDGICFAAVDGRPILANRRINAVCSALTGHTITNAEVMWRELGQQSDKEDVLPEEPGAEDRHICCLPNETVWQFRRQTLSVNGMPIRQYDAVDITELYQYQKQLRASNIRVAQMHDRQRELLQNIVENNLEKELLRAKMRIHGDFGRLLIMTKNELTDESREEDRSRLFTAWENVIADMENSALSHRTSESSPESELVQVADMIGCRLEFIGEQPRERKALLLLYAAIREALTNAVRHAGADRLTIAMTETEREYHAEIRNNGRRVSSIQEGGGLGDLRRRLEQEGAAMEIRCEDGVALCLTIPKR